jgi:hypothetical protein
VLVLGVAAAAGSEVRLVVTTLATVAAATVAVMVSAAVTTRWSFDISFLRRGVDAFRWP